MPVTNVILLPKQNSRLRVVKPMVKNFLEYIDNKKCVSPLQFTGNTPNFTWNLLQCEG